LPEWPRHLPEIGADVGTNLIDGREEVLE